MKLSDRLLTAAKQVRKGSVCADIGTDHGYLAVWLACEKICPRIYAADVNQGPLNAAARTVEKYKAGGLVHLVLSDGLQNLPVDQLDDIVIAGMGGDLISQLIEVEPRLRDPQKRLILQPMTKAQELRKNLYYLGFQIDYETVVQDGRFVYTVLVASYTGKSCEVDGWFALVGKIDPVLGKKYVEKLQKAELKKAAGLRKSGNNDWKQHQQFAQRLQQMGKDD